MNVPMPTVVTKVITPVNGLYFEVHAYRVVTEDEARRAIAEYFRKLKNGKLRKPAPGSTVKVLTLHGAVR